MVDPATATLIASAIANSVKIGSDMLSGKKGDRQSKRKAREMQRETEADMLNEAFQRSADLEGHRLNTRKRLGKRKGQSMQETSDLMRGALNI